MTPSAAKALLASLPMRLESAVTAALDDVAEMAATEARRLLAGTSASPSLPGSAAADVSGALAASLITGRSPEGGAVLKAAQPYAADLEYGTARMAARPFLRPAVMAANEAATTVLAEAVGRAVSAAVEDFG